jgi:signal transduction histidine kinase/ligand-binding sensor domain-containing protein
MVFRFFIVNIALALLPIVATGAVMQARVADAVVHLPVVEANGLKFRRISTSDGLSQTRAAQIVQDDQGFIWFGTQYGINRYDGYEFRLFVHDPTRANSLCGAYVHSLFKDRSGMLWIGCNQLVDRFDPRTETFTHYRVEPEGLDNQNMTVFHISQDGSGMIWLATNAGLHRLDPSTGTVTHFRHSPDRPQGLSTNDINWTGEDRNGSFWVGSRDGLDEFNRLTGTVVRHLPVPDRIQVSFFEDAAGEFWITNATGSGLALYDRGSNTLTRYTFQEQEPPPDGYTGVTGMVEDREGKLWIGSPGMGLLQFDRAHRRFIRYRNRPHDLQSIGQDKVIALFEDSAGNIWVGLHAVGPNYFVPYADPFTIFKHDPDDPNSLPSDFVNAIYEDPHGILWMGNDHGLYEFNRSTGAGKLITAGLGDNPMVINVIEDATGIVWFGTHGHGLGRYDPRSGRYTMYQHDPADPGSLSNDVVHRLFIDRRGTLWVGTEGGGLNALDAGSHRFRHYYAGSETVAGQYYLSISQDAAGMLWLATGRSGLQHFDPATGAITVYKANRKELNGLRDNIVQSVYVSSAGTVWIATQNGLNELDPATGKFTAYDTTSGMPANFVSCLVEDDQGNIWMSTTRGLSAFNPRSRRFSNYSVADGLPGNDLTGYSACFKSGRGELFFGGYVGGVAFFPDQIREPSRVPRVVLTSLEVSGATVPIGQNELLHQSIAYTDRLILRHEQNSFALHFAGIDYVSPESNRARYRLSGLDNRWYEAGGSTRIARYSALPAGDYEFHLQAASGRGHWSEPGASLRITVLPPWWGTWWFKTLYVTAALLILGAAYIIRMRQLSRQLTIRMEERINERTRIARDLHDTLLQGLLSASLQLSIANSQLPSEAKAKSLVDRVSQLLKQMIEESRNTVRGLRVHQRANQGLEAAIAEIPRDLGLKDDVGIELIVEGERRSLRPAVHGEVYWIARESIANAVRHASAATIEVELEYSRSRFRFTVRDDGRGIDPQILQAGRENHWGLSGMTERAAKIGATLNVSSAPGAGTEVDLSIPADIAFEPMAAAKA